MTKSIQQLLDKNPYLSLSTKEVLANYSHIELTEEEYDKAILDAKQRKERLLRDAEMIERGRENRKLLTKQTWDFDTTKSFMLYRAQKLYHGQFELDVSNKIVFDLLCYYFAEDPAFVKIATEMGCTGEISLKKGIMLAGNFGTGKTWLLKLFAQNRRQTYYIRTAKEIASDYQTNGADAFEKYLKLFENPVNDVATLYQKHSGLCIDDLGAEDAKNNFGNRINVLGDLIEGRYFNELTGPLLHVSTNLTTKALEQFYGGRVKSRLREIFNLIELPGNDRRK